MKQLRREVVKYTVRYFSEQTRFILLFAQFVMQKEEEEEMLEEGEGRRCTRECEARRLHQRNAACPSASITGLVNPVTLHETLPVMLTFF